MSGNTPSEPVWTIESILNGPFYYWLGHVLPTGKRKITQIGVNLAQKHLGRTGKQWVSTNKTRLRQLTQWFYFVRNGTCWDNWLGIKSQLLYHRLTGRTAKVLCYCTGNASIHLTKANAKGILLVIFRPNLYDCEALHKAASCDSLTL